MVAKKSLKSQLTNIGFHFRIFGRSEVKELQKVLRMGESIYQCAYGYYHGGSGLLVVTDQRILLIDKRTLYLNLEEFSYESIKSVNLTTRALQANLTIQGNDKFVVFRSISDARLRSMCQFINEAAKRFEATKKVRMEEQLKPEQKTIMVWRPNNAVLVPRLRPTKFYGNTLSHQ